MQVRERLREIADSLRSRYVERSEFIEGLLLAAVSGQHIFVLGPPGVAKTDIIEEFCQCIDGQVFDRTMMKTTTVDELFGPTNVKSYREDGIYERVTKNMAPEAHVLSLDEIWKGGSATLNSLLRLLSQRKYVQGVEWKDSPLIFAVGASNELPQDQTLRAMYSRFQLRFTVDQVKSWSNLSEVLWGVRPELTKTRVSIDEIHAAQSEVENIPFHASAKESLRNILSELREAGVYPDTRKVVALASNRRSVVQAAAWLEGALQVFPRHLTVLRNALWDVPKQIDSVADIVARHSVEDGEMILREANDIIELARVLDIENAADKGSKASPTDCIDIVRRSTRLKKKAETAGFSLPQATSDKLEDLRDQAARAYVSQNKL